MSTMSLTQKKALVKRNAKTLNIKTSDVATMPEDVIDELIAKLDAVDTPTTGEATASHITAAINVSNSGIFTTDKGEQVPYFDATFIGRAQTKKSYEFKLADGRTLYSSHPAFELLFDNGLLAEGSVYSFKFDGIVQIPGGHLSANPLVSKHEDLLKATEFDREPREVRDKAIRDLVRSGLSREQAIARVDNEVSKPVMEKLANALANRKFTL